MQKLREILFLLVLFLIGLLTIASVNYTFDAGFKLSKTTNIPFAGRMIENGLIGDFLQENCGRDDFISPICDYSEYFSQKPSRADFLWNESSPLYSNGCMALGWENCWIEKDEYFAELLVNILKSPKYQAEIAQIAIIGTLKQLVTFKQHNLVPQDVEQIIEKYYEDDLFSYKLATQQTKEEINLWKSNFLEAIAVFIAGLFLLITFFYYRASLDIKTKFLVLFIIISISINAFIYATFFEVSPKYQEAVIYLLPMVALIVLFKRYKYSNKNEQVKLNDYI